VKIKNGVTMTGLQLPMRLVLKEANWLWKEHGEELVVTAATDGEHSAGSLHYYGYAVDLRCRYFSTVTSQTITDKLQVKIGSGYTVLFETDHIHVQYNIHKMNG